MTSVQKLIRRDLEIGNQVHVTQIACGKQEVRILLMIHNENLTVESQSRQRLGEGLGFVILESECIDNVELVFLELQRKRRSQGRPKHLSRQVVGIIARLRTKNRAAFPPQRIADLTDSRPARP